MNGNTAIDFRNPGTVRKIGMAALNKELGAVGTAYFIRQFGTGHGDYTAERDKLLEGMTLDDIIKNVHDLDNDQNP